MAFGSPEINAEGYYTVPHLPLLLSTTTFLVLLRVLEHVADYLTNAHLLGSLLLGILWGSPHVGDLLTAEIISTFTVLGYIGLLLLIFSAGLATPLRLLLDTSNLALSMLVAATGIALPFALSFALLHGAFGYTIMQTFGAGAALCSTSLGTTIALLDHETRTTRVGVVLMTAALADDVVGLVIAGIVPKLVPAAGGIHWSTIVRPILVSLAFTFGTPAAAYACKRILPKNARFSAQGAYFFVIVAVLSAFVAGSHYAGTSELYGAYLAGTFLSYVFEPDTQAVVSDMAIESDDQAKHGNDGGSPHPILTTFNCTLDPILTNLLSPLFFATIGACLPVQHLFTTTTALGERSHAVIWKGIVYSLLMIIAKVGTGVWMLVWPPEKGSSGGAPLSGNASSKRTSGASGGSLESRISQALFLGLAMVARGEIALIVAQLAHPLLVSGAGEELFAIVIWAILVTTVCGALGVGLVLRVARRK